MSTISIHPSFRLNGTSIVPEALQELAYSYIKEGAGYEAPIGAFLLDWLSTSETLTVKTSGSTGTPKQLVIKKRHMVNSALATGTFFGLQAGNTALHCLPTDFIAGKMMLVRAMVLGLRLTCVPPASNPLESTSAPFDFVAMVPLQLRNSISKIDTIKTLIVGGAPFSNDLKELVRDRSANIYETYGMTETITHIALKRINHLDDNQTANENDSFKTLPNVKIGRDHRDCLVINAPNISDAEIITNDVVRLISETEFQWLGRYDTIINSGGVKLIPEQIESILSHLIPNRFFVAGFPDEKLGQKLVLLIEGKVTTKDTLDNIRRSGMLDQFSIPKELIRVPVFTETDNGKIDRTATLKSVIG